MPEIIVDGIKTSYLFDGDISNRLPTVLFIHGACQGLWNWKHQLSSFKSYKRFNFIAVDLPGHGLSEGNGFSHIKNYADFIHSFTQKMEIDELVLVGHSMGGRISQVCMLDYPDNIVAGVLCGTGSRLRVTRATFAALEKGSEHFAGIAAENSFSKLAPGELKSEFKEHLLKSNINVCFNDMIACNEFDVSLQIKKINIPILIIAGEKDILAPVSYSKDLNSKIRNSTLKIMESCGHFMMLENPPLFNQNLKSFLDII